MSNYQALAGYPAVSLAGAGLTQTPMPLQLMNGAAVTSATGHIQQVLTGAPNQPQLGKFHSFIPSNQSFYLNNFFCVGLFVFSFLTQ